MSSTAIATDTTFAAHGFTFGEAERTRLLQIVRTRSFSIGGNITLASGKQSSLYFEMKATMLLPEGAFLMACAVGNLCETLGADYAGGLEMGAVPIVCALAPMIHQSGSDMRVFFARKQEKAHGAKKLIEGLAVDESLAGKRVVIVEDVTTTGGSALKSVAMVRDGGAMVEDLITIVDREERAREAFAAAGITPHPVLTASEFQ